MPRLLIICMTSLLVVAVDSQKHQLEGFHSVETYQIRPGILAIPTYSDDGRICSLVIEKQHVSSKGVDLDAEMSSEEIYQIFDELAPKSERGQSTLNLPDGGDVTTVDGGTLDTTAAYEKVSLQMYGKYKKVGARGYVAAMIQWKRPTCKHHYPAGLDDYIF